MDKYIRGEDQSDSPVDEYNDGSRNQFSDSFDEKLDWRDENFIQTIFEAMAQRMVDMNHNDRYGSSSNAVITHGSVDSFDYDYLLSFTPDLSSQLLSSLSSTKEETSTSGDDIEHKVDEKGDIGGGGGRSRSPFGSIGVILSHHSHPPSSSHNVISSFSFSDKSSTTTSNSNSSSSPKKKKRT